MIQITLSVKYLPTALSLRLTAEHFSPREVQAIKHPVIGQEQDRSWPNGTKNGSPLSEGERLHILFTEGASLSARQTLYTLGGRHEIDVMDPDSLCQCRCSSFVSRFFRSPSFSKQPAEFLRFIGELNRKRKYDVVLPTHEQVYLLSRFRDSVSQRVGLAMPPFASLERMQNKAEFGRLLTELGLPQPETVSIRTRTDLDRTWQYPFYLKLPHSTAGSGVFVVEGRDELERRIQDLEQKRLIDGKSEVLVQQPAKGVLSTVQTVFNRGELIGVHMFEARRLGVGGMSTARISVYHAIVREHVAKIGKHLDWHGAFFIDYFYDSASGQPEYIECNPRIGETVNAMLSGVNLPELLVRDLAGESPQPQPPGRQGVLTHNILMILMRGPPREKPSIPHARDQRMPSRTRTLRKQRRRDHPPSGRSAQPAAEAVDHAAIAGVSANRAADRCKNGGQLCIARAGDRGN